MTPLGKNTFSITDLTEQRWIITEEGAGPAVRYRITKENGDGDFTAEEDPRAMHPAEFWDVVLPGKRITKLEGLVDSENAAAIAKIFDKERAVPQHYITALESHGLNGWTLLYRAVLLDRSSETISALVRAGANLAKSQGLGAHPYHEWTPVTVALAREDARLLEALFDWSSIDHDLVVGARAAARLVDRTRSLGRLGPLERVIAGSWAASGWLEDDTPVGPPTGRALAYAAQFLRVPEEEVASLLEAPLTGGVPADLFSSESALSLSLIRGNRERDRFAQLARSAETGEREDCKRFLDKVKTLPGGKRWEGFPAVLDHAQDRLRKGPAGPTIGRKRP